MTELEKITEFAKRKNITFYIRHEILGKYDKLERIVFIFSCRSIYSPVNIPFFTKEYERLLENKKLAEQVVYLASSQLADIKAREEAKKEVKQDMEFFKTLK